MATPIDPAGAASQALYTPPVRIQEPPEAVNVTPRPVNETTQTARPENTEQAQRSNADSRLGTIIDTMA